MTINVYAWPPIAARGRLWTEDHPVQVSRSLLTGAEYLSGFGRPRKRAQIEVPALALDRAAPGYLERLKALVAGVHAVRVTRGAVNWHLDDARLKSQRQSQPVDWTAPPAPVEWDALWWSGTVVRADTATASGAPVLVASGLRPGIIVARPGEEITVFAADDLAVATTLTVQAVARSDASGIAVIPLAAAPAAFTGRRINIGTDPSAVFRIAQPWPDALQPIGTNWGWTFSLREVFADEVGGFAEVNPWRTFSVADIDA